MPLRGWFCENGFIELAEKPLLHVRHLLWVSNTQQIAQHQSIRAWLALPFGTNDAVTTHSGFLSASLSSARAPLVQVNPFLQW